MQSNHWEKLTFSQSKDQQISEFIRKYQNTYLQMEYNGQKRIVRFSETQSDGDDNHVFYFNDVETGALFEIRYDTDVVLTARFPSTKYVNLDIGVRFFTRVPAKQYLRAPHEGNCITIDPVQRLAYRKVLAPRYDFDVNVLIEAFNPKYTPWETAIELLAGNCAVGRALSPEFALTKHHENKTDMLLWYKLWPVATVTEDGVIKTHVPSLYQEISDFVKRNKIGVQIV